MTIIDMYHHLCLHSVCLLLGCESERGSVFERFMYYRSNEAYMSGGSIESNKQPTFIRSGEYDTSGMYTLKQEREQDIYI